MSSDISLLFGPKMPFELKQIYLSYLPLTERFRAKEVCEEWSRLVSDHVIWSPVYDELKLSADRLTGKESECKTTAVLTYLETNQALVDEIISLIDNDQQLAYVINCPLASSAKLKKMMPLVRTLYVMRGLRKDCTQLFIHLLQKLRTNFSAVCAQSRLVEIPGRRINEVLDQFFENDKCLPLLMGLIQAPPGDFDAGKVMAAAIGLMLIPQCIGPVTKIFALFAQSKYNLSAFFYTSVVFKYREFTSALTGMNLVLEVLVPNMEEQSLVVTNEDLIACKFPPDLLKKS